jgi:hypothetical protein
MNAFFEIILAVLGTILVPLIGVAGRALVAVAEANTQRALATVQLRLGTAAGRIAAELATQVGQGALARTITPGLIEAAAEQLRDRFAETVARHGITDETLSGMIAGELGKIGVSIYR